ncbi:MAG: hypothetical protein ACK4M6_13345, partial [Hyphomonas sp.]
LDVAAFEQRYECLPGTRKLHWGCGAGGDFLKIIQIDCTLKFFREPRWRFPFFHVRGRLKDRGIGARRSHSTLPNPTQISPYNMN